VRDAAENSQRRWRLVYVFISPNHGSSSTNYSKHNIQQNKQKKEEET